MPKPIPFDKFTIRVYSDGYILDVDKMRPPNAPRHRHTEADRKRRRYISKENMRLAEEGMKNPPQTLDEVVAIIKSYPGMNNG